MSPSVSALIAWNRTPSVARKGRRVERAGCGFASRITEDGGKHGECLKELNFVKPGLFHDRRVQLLVAGARSRTAPGRHVTESNTAIGDGVGKLERSFERLFLNLAVQLKVGRSGLDPRASLRGGGLSHGTRSLGVKSLRLETAMNPSMLGDAFGAHLGHSPQHPAQRQVHC